MKVNQKRDFITFTFKVSASQTLLFDVPVFLFITVIEILGNFMSIEDPTSTVMAKVLEISAVILRMLVAVLTSSFFLLPFFSFSVFLSLLSSFFMLMKFRLDETDLKKFSTFDFVASLTIS